MLFPSTRRSNGQKGTFCLCSSCSRLSGLHPLRFPFCFVWQEKKTAGSKRLFFFPLSEEKERGEKNTREELSPDSDWKYGGLESPRQEQDEDYTFSSESMKGIHAVALLRRVSDEQSFVFTPHHVSTRRLPANASDHGI